MTTLFDVELYQDFEKQSCQRDWDKVFYDPAWDEPNGLPGIEQNKVAAEEDEALSPQNKSSLGLSDSKPSESITLKSADTEELIPTPQSSIQWEQESDLSLSNHSLKAISLWQPYCSLIALGLKNYETRSWKTNYRGKLLICSTAKLTKKQYQQYRKICSSVELPAWDEINFPCGKAISGAKRLRRNAICDLVDCIPITRSFIKEQSETEIKSGDWEVGRYAWKLKNIQPITEPFAVKGKQGLFNISVDTFLSNCEIAELIKTEETTIPIPSEDYLKSNAGGREQGATSKSFSSDEWYTPPHISELVIQVLGQITLDPCADEGKHIRAAQHYTAIDDGLIKEWNGRVFMNPPYSQPSVWIKKLQAEFESGRVTEAIALVPAATDTKWLSPILKSQPVCFWTGRIKFLDMSYKPRLSARQSHCLVYWGENWERFKEVFDSHGVVYPPASMSVKQNVATQNAVLPVGTGSTHLEENSPSVLPVERTGSTQLEEHSPPVLPVGRTGSTHSEENSPLVLPVGTGSTHSEEHSSPVLPVGTGSTHSEEHSSPVLPVERTGSTRLEEYSPSVLSVGTGSTHSQENSSQVLPVERTGSIWLEEYSPSVLPVGTGSTHLEENSSSVLPVERTGSTRLEEYSLSVLPVGTGSTHLEEHSPSVLPVERTGSTHSQENSSLVLPVGTSSTQSEEHSPPVLPVERTGSTQSEEHSSQVLPVERTGSTHSQENSSSVLPVGTGSTQLEEHSSQVLPVGTGSTQSEEDSPPVLPVGRTGSTTRRSYGEGTGRIHWRTITKKNGKQYQQPWYDWQLKSDEKTISKSTYIPKRLLPQVQQLEADKAPVRDILKLLG